MGANDLIGLVVSRGPGIIYHIVPPDKDVIRVTSVMNLVHAKYILDLQANKTVPRKMKIFPGWQGCTSSSFREICHQISSSVVSGSQCGDEEVTSGCDGRNVAYIDGHWLASWTYGEHYLSKGLMTQTRLDEIKMELEELNEDVLNISTKRALFGESPPCTETVETYRTSFFS